MWLFTTLGFFSITQSKVERGQFQIRARQKADLETLNNVFGMGCRLVETPDADYRWRVTISPEQLLEVFAMLPTTILYQNFKDAVHHTHGQEDKGGPYMRVWSVMKDLQDRENGPRRKEMVGGGYVEWSGEPVELGQEFLFGRTPGPDDFRGEDFPAAVPVDPLDNPKARKAKKKSAARKALDANRE